MPCKVHPTVLRLIMPNNIMISIISICLLVFWRAQRGDTHFCIASIGQNVVAAVVALTCWFILERGKNIGDVSYCVHLIFHLLLTVYLPCFYAQDLTCYEVYAPSSLVSFGRKT